MVHGKPEAVVWSDFDGVNHPIAIYLYKRGNDGDRRIVYDGTKQHLYAVGVVGVDDVAGLECAATDGLEFDVKIGVEDSASTASRSERCIGKNEVEEFDFVGR